MAHKTKGASPSTHRLSPYAKKIIKNTKRVANVARDLKLPHRHR